MSKRRLIASLLSVFAVLFVAGGVVVWSFPLAKQARIQGTVMLNVTIGQDGRVENLTALGGHPLLIPAALEAVKQWVYRPTLLNGNPVVVISQVEVTFTLDQ